jgi:antirestriction protein ArdC
VGISRLGSGSGSWAAIDALTSAELGAAFLCAELSIKGELEHHASYLHNWLGVLKQDKTALFRAAADASRASEYLHSLQPARGEQSAVIVTSRLRNITPIMAVSRMTTPCATATQTS